MPANDNPTRAQQQKGYRELENFVLNSKVEGVLQDAVKNKAVEKLKKDPRQYLVDKKIKVPLDSIITIRITSGVICFWICRRYGRYIVLCVRRCFPIFVVVH